MTNVHLFDLTPLIEIFGSVYLGGAVLVVLGVLVGTVSALFGIGGGFLVTPFFHSVLHLPATMAVTTSMGQISFMSASGSVHYLREGKIRFKHALVLLAGSIPAAQLVASFLGGVRESAYASDAAIFGLSIADFVLLVNLGLFLGLLGVYNLHRGLKAGKQARQDADALRERQAAGIVEDAGTPALSITSDRLILTFVVGLIFGALSALLGIGGGFFAVPFFVYVTEFEPVEGVATSLFAIFVTSTITNLRYAYDDHIYLALSALVGAGAVVGAQLGSRFAIRIAPHLLLTSLGITQLIVAAGYVALRLG